MERAFVDTSAWIAHANAGDREHAAVRSTLTAWRGRLVTSSFVFDETVTLASRRFGRAIATRLGGLLQDDRAVQLVRPTAADERQAWTLRQRRSDQPYSFTDCTSFVLRDRLGLRRVVALDADFRREGFVTLP
jgi:predicted nucleic acid-binding protein